MSQEEIIGRFHAYCQGTILENNSHYETVYQNKW